MMEIENGQRLRLVDEQIGLDFARSMKKQIEGMQCHLENMKEIKIEGCRIDSFAFLDVLPNLTHMYVLACRSDVWEEFKGTPHMISLGLHNLKQGKMYLSTTAFLDTFPNLEYLYVAMMGVSSYPNVIKLQHLHTVIGTFRNENNKKEMFDFSSFEHMPNLNIFYGYMAVDTHRIAAEAFIPIIKNPSLNSFYYSQRYVREDKKLEVLIKQLHPSLLKTTLSWNEIMRIRYEHFCQ